MNEGEGGGASGARGQIPLQTACAEPGCPTAAHRGPWLQISPLEGMHEQMDLL